MSGKLTRKGGAVPKRKGRTEDGGVRKERKRKRAKAQLDNLCHCDAVHAKILNKKSAHRKGLARNDLFKIALSKFDRNRIETNNIGKMNCACRKGCGALHFKDESTANICCNKEGLGSHRFLEPIPDFLRTQLQDVDFRRQIRHYNNTFQIATIGSTLGPKSYVVHASFPYYIRVHGSIYHSLPPMVPDRGEKARFGQLYVIDNALEDITERRTALDANVVAKILDYIKKNNPWAQAIHSHVNKLMRGNLNIPTIQLEFQTGTKQYQVPKVDEIAGFVPDLSVEFDTSRSIYLNNAGKTFTCINELNPFYDPAHYVIMFPNGDMGYDRNSKEGTVLQFYQQRLQVRPNKSLYCFGKLFHEYAIDQFCKVEKARLDYIRYNQQELRCCNQNNNERPEEMPVGLKEGSSFVYLPHSFVGSPRYFRHKYLDALNVVNHFGAASYFITMTCNPKWKEILDELKGCETVQDRADLTARVFRMKLRCLIDDILKNGILGECIAHLIVEEFQKKGLPHGHLLIFIDPSDRPRNVDDIEKVVCAELPDRFKEPELFGLVTKHMLHGPCNEYCNAGGESEICRFGYPKPYLECSTWDGESRVEYRRRKDGRQFRGKDSFIYTNRNIVPYNPYLLAKYQCHINILVCCTKIASVRYLFQYVTKGCDMATIKMTMDKGVNEIDTYLSGRYISAQEAIWKLLKFGILEIQPATERLPVHLPGKKFRVMGKVGELPRKARNSQLEGFFKLNSERLSERPPDEFYLLYTNVSRYYVWDNKNSKFRERKQLGKTAHGIVLNRMDNVSIKEGERYYLRLLLQHIANPTCFEDLCQINGESCASFQDACRELGLLSDDVAWKKTMKEAVLVEPPSVVRHIFAQILAFCDVQDPLHLYLDNLSDMAEDFRRNHGDETGVTRFLEGKVIESIERLLCEMNRSLDQIAPMRHLLAHQTYSLERKVKEEVTYNSSERKLFADSFLANYEKMNTDQKKAADELVNAYETSKYQRRFVLMAAAGTGKTFVQNTFISYVKAKEGTNICFVAMSTTAISAQLLEDGRTAHSTLRFPIEIISGAVRSSLDFDSPQALQMRSAKVLIWDEVFGARKELIDAANIFFQELHGNKLPFGGVLCIFSGDIRQTLPKLERASRSTIAKLCFTESMSYATFGPLSLEANMRLLNSGNEDYAKFLLEVGKGTSKEVNLPSYVRQTSNAEDLFEFVYGADLNNTSLLQLATSAIVTPLNATVREINVSAIRRIRGKLKIYKSHDEELDGMGNIVSDLPVEVLNSIVRPGLPVHALHLKVGALVMCVRNLTRFVCNGTKLRVEKLHEHLLDCLVLTGPGAGMTITLPRITLIEKCGDDSITLRRKQFPLTLAYAMTIDKSQGQSLERVGLALNTPCFSHGQLYTALSRCKDPLHLMVYNPEKRPIINVVWQEVLQRAGIT